jgi:hypothetical protein
LQSRSTKDYADDIRRLEVLLGELKVKYDQFFVGALDRQPLELRQQADRIVQRITHDPPSKYAMRFHFNALVSRYNSFSELWGKTVRTMEEGDHRSLSISERFGLKQHLITRASIGDPEKSRAEMQRLHRRFVEARERHGKRPVSYEKFARGIGAQSRRLRREHGCDQIEVRLVESGDDIQVRARPGR